MISIKGIYSELSVEEIEIRLGHLKQLQGDGCRRQVIMDLQQVGWNSQSLIIGFWAHKWQTVSNILMNFNSTTSHPCIN